MTQQKKVIIIGSGLGGLSCGAILAKNGYTVTVLEQGVQVGGCLQCFSRRGAKFETGMHFIGSAAHGQTLDKLMRYLEIDKTVTLSQLDPQGYDVVSLGGKKYAFANGREAFLKQMTEYFPSQHDNLVRYYDLIEEIANASSLHSLKYADSDSPLNMEYQLRSINAVIDEVITDPVLAKVLVGNLPLYAAEKNKTPFATHAFIMDFYNQSAFRVKGGSDSIATALMGTINRYGGEVLTRKKVTRIICDDTHAVGVEVNGKDTLPCDIIISDAHPMRTLELLDTKLIRPAFRKRINHIPQTVGGFSVYLHFKEKTVPYLNLITMVIKAIHRGIVNGIRQKAGRKASFTCTSVQKVTRNMPLRASSFLICRWLMWSNGRVQRSGEEDKTMRISSAKRLNDSSMCWKNTSPTYVPRYRITTLPHR